VGTAVSTRSKKTLAISETHDYLAITGLDPCILLMGDRPQGVAGDCNSLAETHAAEVAENISISGTLAFTQ